MSTRCAKPCTTAWNWPATNPNLPSSKSTPTATGATRSPIPIKPTAPAREIEEYRKTKDPLAIAQQILTDEGVLTPEIAKEIDQAARAEAEGDLATDDAVAAPIVVGRVKIVHRSTLALGATGDLAV